MLQCCSDILEYHINVTCPGYNLMLNLCMSDTEKRKGGMPNRGNC